MGIHMLNRFIQYNCPDSLSCIPLSSLSGKKIAVDISIYLYKYLSENALLENLYLMISIFRHHNIIPIFVFDGKPPIEKNETIELRKKHKKNAYDEYNKLKKLLDEVETETTSTDIDTGTGTGTGTGTDGLKKENTIRVEIDEDTFIEISSTNEEELRNTMKQLKKKFIMLKKKHIQDVKTLLQAYGMTYYESPGEADILCANLVSKNIVYACLSEDTDMFVYGCSRVLRYLSLTSSTVILYDFQNILKTLDSTLEEFKQFSIMFGCDYLRQPKEEKNKIANTHTHTTPTNIFTAYKLFKRYKTSAGYIECGDFYNWTNDDQDNNIENCYLREFIEKARKIIKLFDISSYDNLQLYDKIKIMNSQINRVELVKIMEKENFIFVK